MKTLSHPIEIHAINEKYSATLKNRMLRGIQIFLFLIQNIDCRYSLEPAIPTINVLSEKKNQKYFFFSQFLQHKKVSVYSMGMLSYSHGRRNKQCSNAFAGKHMYVASGSFPIRLKFMHY